MCVGVVYMYYFVFKCFVKVYLHMCVRVGVEELQWDAVGRCERVNLGVRGGVRVVTRCPYRRWITQIHDRSNDLPQLSPA